jgi:D-glycero-beta-D-manno-heptose-7-phosphate kinase
MIASERAAEILDEFSRIRILTVGDLMLDRYVFGAVNRISPEAPVPIVQVNKEYARPGGAANVALNVLALGARPAVCGMVGNDAGGDELVRAMREAGMPDSGVLRCDGVQTTVKTRVIAERQQVVRVDRERPWDAPAQVEALLVECAAAMAARCDGVILEDYGRGVIGQAVVDAVLCVARERGIPVGFDPKDNYDLDVGGITLATPNYREACLTAGIPERALGGELLDCPSLREAGRILSARWKVELLMITLGPHGMYVLPQGGVPAIIPTQAREVFDVSGAGDTVMAVALTALAAGAGYVEAAELANHAGGIVVGKIGTAPCHREELLSAIENEAV